MSNGAISLPDDMALAKDCLAGEPDACAKFENGYHASLRNILMARGASQTDANDLTRDLLSDSLMGKPGDEALLHRYNGKCSLQSWLATCATNRFIDLIRRRNKQVDLHGNTDEKTTDPLETVPDPGTRQAEANLTVLLRRSLEVGFAACPAESRLMLRLVYPEGLTQREVGRMWNYHETKVSRQLQKAMKTIRAATLTRVREIDPFLRLTWEDFLELCESSLTGLPW